MARVSAFFFSGRFSVTMRTRSAVSVRMCSLMAPWMILPEPGLHRPSQGFSNGLNLVLVHEMAHTWINALVYRRAHLAQHVGRLVYARDRTMRVHVAAAQKHVRAVERARVVARRARRSDQAAAQRKHARITLCVTRGEFERQARTLRKAEEADPRRRDTLFVQRLDEPRQHSQS